MDRLKLIFIFYRVAYGSLGPCSLENEDRRHVFVIFSESDWETASLESVYFIYPEAHVVVIGKNLDDSVIGANARDVRSKGYCLSFYDPGDADMHLAVYSFQALYGGLYIPFDGILLNSLEHVTRHLNITSSTPIFQEIIISSRDDLSGFTESDFEKFMWKRPVNDFHANITFACSLHCVRYIPKGSYIRDAFLAGINRGWHPDKALTDILRPMLNSVVILPFWLIADPKFPDRWATYGSRPGFTDRSTDLHSPRPKPYRQDYWLITSHKLWLPLNMAISSEKNVFDLSVISLVRQEFTLNLFSDPFVPIGGTPSANSGLQLKTALDQVKRLVTSGYFHYNEIGLPGEIGGYRTFKHLRIVSENSSIVRVEISITTTGNSVVEFSNGNSRVNICGTQAFVNSEMHRLRYNAKNDDRDFATITISASFLDSCQEDGSKFSHVTQHFQALVLDPVRYVTIIAHSADRCDLLERMITSIRKLYPGMLASVTCERTSSEEGISVSEFDGVKWYSVPDDFGLSRGKSFLISTVTTEFVLVLDDDFTASFNTCIECLVLRMKSKSHSAVLPLDIVGFPVLEDERAFGAFRGTISLSDGQFAIEPFVRSITPDGCFRVDICPMVFLGRTARLKTFEWNPDLPVGEHEMFFLRNQFHGLQVAVCPDSTFVHFRAPPSRIPPEYTERRNRQGQLMASVFANAGIGRTMYLFGKYSHQSEIDFQALNSSGINPYSIRDDSADSSDHLAVPLLPCLIVILSNHLQQRDQIRVQFKHCKLLFFSSQDSDLPTTDVIKFREGAESLHFILETTRKFASKFVFLIDDTCASNTTSIRLLIESPSTHMRMLELPGIIGLSRDFAWLLSHPMVLRNLKRAAKFNHADLLLLLREWASVFQYEPVIVPTIHPSH